MQLCLKGILTVVGQTVVEQTIFSLSRNKIWSVLFSFHKQAKWNPMPYNVNVQDGHYYKFLVRLLRPEFFLNVFCICIFFVLFKFGSKAFKACKLEKI
jgi:hypothetical protein